MTKNVGGIDRILRIVLGALLVIIGALMGYGWWMWVGIVRCLPPGSSRPACLYRLMQLFGMSYLPEMG